MLPRARSRPRDETGRSRRRGGVTFAIRVEPLAGERLGVSSLHERPHAAAEPGAKRRRGTCALLAREARERDRLRHLVAEQRLGRALRPVDERPERVEARGRERLDSRGQDLAILDEEVLQPRGQRRPVRGTGGDAAEARHRVGHRVDGLRQRLVGAAGLRSPALQELGDHCGRAVVGATRRAGLVGGNAAGGDDEHVVVRERDLPQARHRKVAVAGQLVGRAQKDRRVVLAAARGADAVVAGERAERAAVLDAAKISGQLEIVGNRGAKRRARGELVDLDEHQRDGGHQGARRAEAGGPWQGVREGDVGAALERSEVAGKPARHGHRIVRPVADRRLDARLRWKVDATAVVGVEQPHQSIAPRPEGNGEAALGSAREAASAGVVGVLAEHLDAPRHEELRRRAAVRPVSPARRSRERRPRGRPAARRRTSARRWRRSQPHLDASQACGNRVDVGATRQVEHALVRQHGLDREPAVVDRHAARPSAARARRAATAARAGRRRSTRGRTASSSCSRTRCGRSAPPRPGRASRRCAADSGPSRSSRAKRIDALGRDLAVGEQAVAAERHQPGQRERRQRA